MLTTFCFTLLLLYRQPQLSQCFFVTTKFETIFAFIVSFVIYSHATLPERMKKQEKMCSHFSTLKRVTNRMKLLWIWNNSLYSARRLMGSRIIGSAAYCNQILLAQLYINSAQNSSVNWNIRLLLSLSCWPKVILLSGGHCSTKISYTNFFISIHVNLLYKIC